MILIWCGDNYGPVDKKFVLYTSCAGLSGLKPEGPIHCALLKWMPVELIVVCIATYSCGFIDVTISVKNEKILFALIEP